MCVKLPFQLAAKFSLVQNICNGNLKNVLDKCCTEPNHTAGWRHNSCAHLQPRVVEGLIDGDPLSRVQHQHTSHQVLGTL